MKLKQDKEFDILTLKEQQLWIPETMKEVPKDGKTIGEIMLRGNVVMKGYFKDKAATDKLWLVGGFILET
jgi:long-subunit acyl-CoA synthetase (AMP-forming)